MLEDSVLERGELELHEIDSHSTCARHGRIVGFRDLVQAHWRERVSDRARSRTYAYAEFDQ